MSLKEVTIKVYSCQVCNYQSKNDSDFNKCLVCGKMYCFLYCKSDLYFVHHQHVCRICKDNPIVDEVTQYWLEIWRKQLPLVNKDYEKITKKALKLDRRFDKNWEINLKRYKAKQSDDTTDKRLRS